MNTLQLYGDIVDVFEGKIIPSTLTPGNAGVSESLSFGLGVSCFEDDLSNVGDAVYFNGRFFIRSTDEGERRDPLGGKYKESRVQDYRTVYSLGITEHPLDMGRRSFLVGEFCENGFTVEDLIDRIVGPARIKESAPRTYGFLGLLDYEKVYSTSLAVAPIHGENIIPLMEKYARSSDPLPRKSGVVMGFVRDRVRPGDPLECRQLGRRLFFDNPKDNERALEVNSPHESGVQEKHWISHTHGIRLHGGTSALPAERESFLKLGIDHEFTRAEIDRALNRTDYEDCGHIIPQSTLRRYFVVVFPIENIESFYPGATS